MPLAKINYFLNEGGGGCTSVFLHYRMDRALRAIIVARWLGLRALQPRLPGSRGGSIGFYSQATLVYYNFNQ